MPDGRYLTVDEWKSWARDEVTVDDAEVGAAIVAAQQYIDNACSRRFAVAGSASARVYTPDRPYTLIIDDCTTITSVVENGTTLATTVYQAEPLNNLSSGGETVPFDRIKRLSGCWYRHGHEATVTVTATWGWAAVPFEVVEACKLMTKMILEGRDTKFGVAGFTETAAVGQRFDTLLRPIVAQYTGPRGVLVA